MGVTAIEAPSAAKSSINPISGVFGTGQIQLIFKDGNFIAPITGKYRIRVWGAGGRFANDTGGAGGGFAMKVIDLNEDDVIPVTVALSSLGNTSSFGSYVSATSGETASSQAHTDGGIGVGGDFNSVGGRGNYSGTGAQRRAGGAASLFGNGGDAVGGISDLGGSGPSNNGQYITNGHGLDFRECLLYGLDFVGAGKGATETENAKSGGGPHPSNSYFSIPGFPAAGGVWQSPNGYGANGLVAVEY